MKTCLLLLLPLPIILALVGFLAFFGISANTATVAPFEPITPAPVFSSSAAEQPHALVTGEIEIYSELPPTTPAWVASDGIYDIVATDSTQTYVQINYDGQLGWISIYDDVILPVDLSLVPVIEAGE